MKLASVDSKVLLALYNSSRGLHVFSIYKRLNFPLGTIVQSVLKLRDSGLVCLTEEEHASLSEKGNERAYRIAAEVSHKAAKPWRDVPNRFKKQSQDRDMDFYIPKLTLLSKNFFC